MNEEIKVKVLIGDEVFKVCPKCNDKHNGTCEFCAWRGCIWHYCNIEPRIYWDGSGKDCLWQLVKREVTEQSFIHINEEWNIAYFATVEEGLQAISEFNEICKIEDKNERYNKFCEWHKKRKQEINFRRVKENED